MCKAVAVTTADYRSTKYACSPFMILFAKDYFPFLSYVLLCLDLSVKSQRNTLTFIVITDKPV